MACPGLETIDGSDIIAVLSYPNTCDYFFYAKILGAIWVILSFILFKRDEDKVGKGELLSSMGVAALAVIVMGIIGNTAGFIPTDVFVTILAAGLVLIIIWIVKSKST